MPLRQRPIIVPLESEAAALENMKKIRNPKAFEKIEHRQNKETGKWEVVLIPKP